MKNSSSTRLLVRADDMGSCLASNLGCLKSVTEGIATSLEVMMPCPWVEHSASLMNDHTDVDIGIHLTLSSEWDAVKWRPLTQASSLVNDRGYFYPLLLPRAGDNRPCLQMTDWSLDDIATELRQQIIHGLHLFPHASHVSSHMAWHFSEFAAEVGTLVSNLCDEFNLINEDCLNSVQFMEGYSKFPRDEVVRTESFVRQLEQLNSGTYIFVDHPAVDTEENRMLGHPGYEDVLVDRSSCLTVLTDPLLRQTIIDRGIQLIDYRELVRG